VGAPAEVSAHTIRWGAGNAGGGINATAPAEVSAISPQGCRKPWRGLSCHRCMAWREAFMPVPHGLEGAIMSLLHGPRGTPPQQLAAVA
jgi:hypothetical protein